MNKLFLGLASAVTLSLPFSTFAQAKRPDPADASAPGPALQYRSAFADYKPWQDIKLGDWRTVNDKVRDAGAEGGGGHAGHGMSRPSAPAASTPQPKASSPAMPSGHSGHSMPGGKP